MVLRLRFDALELFLCQICKIFRTSAFGSSTTRLATSKSMVARFSDV
jgi:hypothetical protein